MSNDESFIPNSAAAPQRAPHPDPERRKEEGWDTTTSGLLVMPSQADPSPVISTGAKRSGEICCTSGAQTKPRRRLRQSLLVLLAAAVVLFGAHASDTPNGQRYDKLSHAMMCPCGCNQLLGECNHVGCPDSDKMRAQLAASIDKGEDDSTIFHAFQDQYGPTALAAPMFTRFNQFSWWLPPLVLLVGIAGVFAVVRRWRPRVAAMPARATDPYASALQERVRRETGGDSL